MLSELGLNVGVITKSYDNAAIAVANRRRLGDVRRTEACHIWLQGKVGELDTNVVNVASGEHVAHAMA